MRIDPKASIYLSVYPCQYLSVSSVCLILINLSHKQTHRYVSVSIKSPLFWRDDFSVDRTDKWSWRNKHDYQLQVNSCALFINNLLWSASLCFSCRWTGLLSDIRENQRQSGTSFRWSDAERKRWSSQLISSSWKNPPPKKKMDYFAW